MYAYNERPLETKVYIVSQYSLHDSSSEAPVSELEPFGFFSTRMVSAKQSAPEPYQPGIAPTMAEEYLPLALGSVWISVGIRLPEFEIRFHVDLRAAFEHAQVVVHVLVERQDAMPCCLRVIASYGRFKRRNQNE